MEKQLNWYLEQIEREIKPLSGNNYTGKLEFQFNLHQGNIENLNIGSRKSIKAPKTATQTR